MIRTTTSLVLVDVLAKDKTTGEPIKDLNQEDFILRDNGVPISITRFNRGKDHDLRPVQLWFLLSCNEEFHHYAGGGGGGQRRGAGGAKEQRVQVDAAEESGSSFLAGKSTALGLALGHLGAEETVGVAHWCDDGQYDIDAMPTADRTVTLNEVDTIAVRKPVVIEQISDQTAQEQVTRLINNVARTAFPEPFLGLVVVRGKGSENSVGMPLGTLPGLGGGLETGSGPPGGGGPVAQALYTPGAEEYANRLGMFIDGLHSRYEIGFEPGKQSKKRHNITVSLTKSARKRYPDVDLSYREAYTDTDIADEVGTAKNSLAWRQLDSRMQSAVTSRENQSQLSFDVQRTRDAQQQTEHYVLRIAPGALTWEKLPNGDRRSVIMTVVAKFSTKGQMIRLMVKQLEVVQESARLPEIANKPVAVSLHIAVVKSATGVHLVVRDVASGRIGTQVLSIGPEQ